MLGVVLVAAISLGALTAWVGQVLGAWHLGLATLVVGGMVTGAMLAFAPSILFPADQYPVSFMWVNWGAPVGFATWLACTAAIRGSRSLAT
jgi:hypothetical protein